MVEPNQTVSELRYVESFNFPPLSKTVSDWWLVTDTINFLWVKNFQKLTKEVFDGLLQIPITFCEFGDDSHFHLGKVWKNLIESSQKNPIDTLPDSFKILQILARQLQEFPTNIHPWSLFWGLGSTSPLYIIFSI